MSQNSFTSNFDEADNTLLTAALQAFEQQALLLGDPLAARRHSYDINDGLAFGRVTKV